MKQTGPCLVEPFEVSSGTTGLSRPIGDLLKTLCLLNNKEKPVCFFDIHLEMYLLRISADPGPYANTWNEDGLFLIPHVNVVLT